MNQNFNRDDCDKQALFIEAVESLKEFARVNGDMLTRKDILDHFREIELQEENLELIFGYLAAAKIEIVDVDVSENRFMEMLEKDAEKAEEEGENKENDKTEHIIDDAQEDKFLKMYMEDLNELDCLSETSEAGLLINIFEKDDKALDMLIKNYLGRIIEWIEPFRKKGVPAGDLVQEGNLTMLTYLANCEWTSNQNWKKRIQSGRIEELLIVRNELEAALRQEVEKTLEHSVDSQKYSKDINKRVLIKVNSVNDWANRLFESLGRKATVNEIAQKMGITSEEVQEIIDFSSDNIENIQKG